MRQEGKWRDRNKPDRARTYRYVVNRLNVPGFCEYLLCYKFYPISPVKVQRLRIMADLPNIVNPCK
jgi:hypothetical protein